MKSEPNTQTAPNKPEPQRGREMPAPPRVTINTDRNLEIWRERIADEHICWLVVRLIHCKFGWLTVDGQWDRRQKMAAAWSEREEAYQAARSVNGLLYCYDRG